MIDYLPLHISAGFHFSSDWLHYQCESHFDEELMRDPIARHNQDVHEANYVRSKYPDLFGGVTEVHPNPSLGIGVATVPMIFGTQVRYEPHMYPIALPFLKDSDNPMDLREPDLMETMQWLFNEIDALVEAGFKKSNIGLPDLQGELNVAMKLVGDNRLLGLIANKNREPIVRHILDITSDTYIHVVQELRRALGRDIKGSVTVSGCTYYYLSPIQWTKYILPMIQKLEVFGKTIGLHHCGEATTEKIEAYAQYPWYHVELGFGSDLKRARELFTSKEQGADKFICRISPYRMLNQSADQITKDVQWVIDNAKGGPMNIAVVGVPNGTPNENLYAMYNTVEAYNKAKEQELEDE